MSESMRWIRIHLSVRPCIQVLPLRVVHRRGNADIGTQRVPNKHRFAWAIGVEQALLLRHTVHVRRPRLDA